MINLREKPANHERIICAVVSIFVFLCLWQFAAAFTKASLFLAGPVEVIKAFFVSFARPIGEDRIFGHILWSLSRVLTGFVIGSALGVTAGILMGLYKPVNAFIRPLFELIRPIPAIAWIPLSIVWFGLGEPAKYFLIALSSFCAVTINAFTGASSVDEALIGAAKMLGAGDRQIFTMIILPAAVPQIFAGLQIAIGAAWMTVVAAEMVKSSEGLGWIVIKGQEINSMVQILVGILGVGIVGFILATVMRVIEAKLFVWNERGK
ncbi:MAG: ABC transporter permease [Treponema sp.]|jgi:NitT/TauT family transport system permease protein/sulfonate transport system permease protein|nr:ABC transporter permease [Treponema sp.]